MVAKIQSAQTTAGVKILKIISPGKLLLFILSLTSLPRVMKRKGKDSIFEIN